MIPIKAIKPRPIKFFGFLEKYNIYHKRQSRYFSCLPKNGEHIKITWLPKNGVMDNAYIGFEGIVQNMSNVTGEFELNSGTSILLCRGSIEYIKINQ